MLLIPAFVILVLYGYLGWALIVFATAGITDGLDGLIARRSARRHSLALARPDGGQAAAHDHLHPVDASRPRLSNRLPIWLTVLIITRDVGIVLTVTIVNFAIGRRTFRHRLRQDRPPPTSSPRSWRCCSISPDPFRRF
jgi:cardiolipin synthase